MQAFQDWLKTEMLKPRKKIHCQKDMLSTNDAETLAKWLSLLWHGVLGYKSIVT